MRPIVTEEYHGLSSVGLSVTIMRHAKTAEPISMPFGLWTRGGQGTMY